MAPLSLSCYLFLASQISLLVLASPTNDAIDLAVLTNQCYFPSGAKAAGNIRCNDGPGFSTCCGNKDSCLANGLCKVVTSDGLAGTEHSGIEYARGSCTDRTWKDPACFTKCKTSKPGSPASDGAAVFACGGAKGYSQGANYCCETGVNAKDSCCTQGDLFWLGPGTPGSINNPPIPPGSPPVESPPAVESPPTVGTPPTVESPPTVENPVIVQTPPTIETPTNVEPLPLVYVPPPSPPSPSPPTCLPTPGAEQTYQGSPCTNVPSPVAPVPTPPSAPYAVNNGSTPGAPASPGIPEVANTAGTAPGTIPSANTNPIQIPEGSVGNTLRSSLVFGVGYTIVGVLVGQLGL